jgi:predicted  nucleic acid-binding Zn-ribbon protein
MCVCRLLRRLFQADWRLANQLHINKMHTSSSCTAAAAGTHYMAAAAETDHLLQKEVVEVKGTIRDLEKRLQDAPNDQQLKEQLTALRQELAALRQELAALRQKEVLLMQQQAGAAWSQRC